MSAIPALLLGGPNFAVAVHNLGAACAGLLRLISGTYSTRRKNRATRVLRAKQGARVLTGYSFVVIFIGVVSVAALERFRRRVVSCLLPVSFLAVCQGKDRFRILSRHRPFPDFDRAGPGGLREIEERNRLYTARLA